jgi:hypothetical protein
MSGAALKPATARLDFLVVALPSSAFVCGVAVTILAPAAIGDVDFNRTRLTIWTTLLLACPALVLFVLRAGRIPLGLSWRAWWTAAYLAFVLHLVWGYGIMFRGDAGAVLRVQGTLVGVSNFLLAIIWGVSVLTAWAGWRLLPLHAFATLFFSANALVSTLLFGHGPSPVVGGLVAATLVGAAGWRARETYLYLTGTETMPQQPIPAPPDLTARHLASQFWADIYGKEVQSAATYSYTWMADQMGHVCIGLLLDFGFTAIAYHVLPASEFWCEFAGFLLASIVVSYWEYRAYSTDVKKAEKGLFPLGRELLRNNAIIAAAYMILGAAVGWAFHNSVSWAVPAFVILVLVAVTLAPPWLRQKIIWQKAGMPYLARLADTKANMSKPVADALWQMIVSDAPPNGDAQVAVLAGPIGSGRTSSACGIGTEFALRNVSVRYLSFSDLIEFAATANYELAPPPPGPANIGFWPWGSAQVLIIDNLGPLIASSGVTDTLGGLQNLPAWLATWLPNIRDALRARHTVWILGEVGARSEAELSQSARAIAAFLGTTNPLAILLGGDPAEVAARVVTSNDPSSSP